MTKYTTLPSTKKSQTDTPNETAESRELSEAAQLAEQKLSGPPDPTHLPAELCSDLGTDTEQAEPGTCTVMGDTVDPVALVTMQKEILELLAGDKPSPACPPLKRGLQAQLTVVFKEKYYNYTTNFCLLSRKKQKIQSRLSFNTCIIQMDYPFIIYFYVCDKSKHSNISH